jgi:ribosomal protein S18 acetylase RimI-like enzyme
VSLLVREDNHRARRAYEKQGYELTGRAVPCARDRREVGVELRKRIAVLSVIGPITVAESEASIHA